MNQQELEKLVNTPISRLAVLCQDPQTLLHVISLAYNAGWENCHKQSQRWFNSILVGHNEVTIGN